VSTEATIQAGKADYRPIPMDAVLGLLKALHGSGVEVVKTEHLYLFDGERGFSLGQGE